MTEFCSVHWLSCGITNLVFLFCSVIMSVGVYVFLTTYSQSRMMEVLSSAAKDHNESQRGEE